MEFKPCALVLASLLLFSFLQSPQPSNAETKNLLDDFCKQSQHPRFCMIKFGSDPRVPKAKDYLDIATIVLETGSKEAKNYANYAKQLMKTNHVKALSVCAENYEYASRSLGRSVPELSEDAMTANYDAKAANDGARICNDAMAQAKLHIPNIATQNSKVQIYSDLGFTITDIVQREQMKLESAGGSA